MVTYRTSEFFTNLGSSTYGWDEQLRDEIAGFACSLWQQFPSFFSTGDPINSFARGYMNAMCSTQQTPPPPPQSDFTGGQCDAPYHVEVEIDNANTGGAFSCGATRLINTQSTGATVPGPIVGVVDIDLGFGLVVRVQGTSATGTPVYRRLGVPGVGQETSVRSSCGNYSGSDSNAFALPGSARIVNVIRTDGMPDNCGNPPEKYPDVIPTSQDLSTTINITNNDGIGQQFNLVYNQITNGYNFPMGFKLNGVNITLDIEGITIHGAPQNTAPTSGNDVPPPGSDGGNDGVGGNNDTVFPDQEYPTLPEFVIPETVETAIEYVLCTEGVLETINLVIQQTTSISPIITSILAILINIVQEICEAGEEVTALVGIPEYNILRPGIERPAIVYLWKEVIGNVIQASTYSSTVQNPSAAAVAAINTIAVPDKTIGTFMTSVTLNDGSRIRATGDTQANADINFTFLLDQVDNSFKQPDIANRITRSQNTRLDIKTLKCRQIEYYPNGKNANTSPSVRRVIPITT